ncbi:hypothetical protein NA32_09795, partial [Streptococcus hongkongensis]
MFLLFSGLAPRQIKRLIMAGSAAKSGEQQQWLGMTASPSGAKGNNQHAPRRASRRAVVEMTDYD